jgi:hypothetical protein
MKIIRPWTLASLLLVASFLACTPTPPLPTVSTFTAPNGDVITATVVENTPVWSYTIKSSPNSSINFSSVQIHSTSTIDDCKVTNTVPTKVVISSPAPTDIYFTIGVVAASVVIVLNCDGAKPEAPINLLFNYSFFVGTSSMIANGTLGPLAGPKFP